MVASSLLALGVLLQHMTKFLGPHVEPIICALLQVIRTALQLVC